MPNDFHGFPAEVTDFLAGLRDNNDKAWFDANRATWDQVVMPAARAFVVAAGAALQEVAPDVRAEPKVNGSILRINRDARFSTDKRPYKDHLDFWFWEGVERRRAVSGFRLRIQPESVAIGAGAHHFDPTLVNRYRDLVVDDAAGGQLARAVAQVERAGFAVSGEQWKRTPRGWEEPDDALRAALLRHGGLFAGQECSVPASLASGRFVSWCMTRWRKQAPLQDWLKVHLQQG